MPNHHAQLPLTQRDLSAIDGTYTSTLELLRETEADIHRLVEDLRHTGRPNDQRAQQLHNAQALIQLARSLESSLSTLPALTRRQHAESVCNQIQQLISRSEQMLPRTEELLAKIHDLSGQSEARLKALNTPESELSRWARGAQKRLQRGNLELIGLSEDGLRFEGQQAAQGLTLGAQGWQDSQAQAWLISSERSIMLTEAGLNVLRGHDAEAARSLEQWRHKGKSERK